MRLGFSKYLYVLLIASLNCCTDVYCQKLLYTQQDVIDFGGTVFWVGSVTIYGDSTQDVTERITDLTPLLSLQLIEGSLNINNTFLTNLNGLNNIHLHVSFTGSLRVENNSLLTDVSALNGIRCGHARFINNPKLNVNQLDSIDASFQLLIEKMPITSFKRESTALYSAIEINQCELLENLELNYNNDTVFSIRVVRNPNLKSIEIFFDSILNVKPLTYSEYTNLNKYIYITQNPILDTVKLANDYFPLSRFKITENSQLNKLCFIHKSILLQNELAEVYFDSLYGSVQGFNVWNNLKMEYINLNSYPYDNYDNAIIKGCLNLTITEEIYKEKHQLINIYPNPYTGGALQLTGVKVGTAIAVYDIVGKEVFRTQYTGTAISLPQVNKGLYLIEAKNLKGHREYVKLYID